MKPFNSIFRRSLVFLWFVGTLALAGVAQSADTQRFILQCPAPYDGVVAAVEALGGQVTHQYKNIGAVAAVVPSNRRAELLALDGLTAVYKDTIVRAPVPTDIVDIDASEIQGTMGGDELREALGALLQDYLSDNILTGASTLHGGGIFGSGVVVAVIDTGTANNAAVVPSIAGRVIGGENFVPGPEPSATSTFNDDHGTWVGSTIAAGVIFGFFNTSTFVNSLLAHDPVSVLFDFFGPGISGIPMIGSAPGADLYAMKVFSAFGGGAPESRIIAAMDRAITLRRNFNDGVPSVPVSGDGSEDDPFVFDSLNIEVVNMSLGGPNLFVGRDVEDLLTQTMLDVGITLAASAGNEGHAAMTGGSPGTGIGSLTVGAANLVNHERVFRDLQFGLGFGALFRPADHHQTAFFSSRGPTADGRIDPDVTASGFANFAQGAAGGLAVVSGTSFSSPTTAGAAALLREAVPGASATQIRNALIATANPTVLGDDSDAIDQGAGFIDVSAANAALQAWTIGEDLDFGIADDDVEENLEEAGFNVRSCKSTGFTEHFSDLLPGQVAHTFIDVGSKVSQINITVHNITPALPPAQQNVFFGDDIFLNVQDALTSDADDPFGGLFLFTDTTLAFNNPQTGIVRLATMGDWTNAGTISTDLTVSCVKQSEGEETADGEVAQGETDVVTVDLPAGTAEVVFELSWEGNWGSYPTNDLDLILVDPDVGVNFDGATLDSPERVVLGNPPAGTWTAFVDGFTVFCDDECGDDDGDEWELRVTADGERLEDADADDDDDSD